MPSFRLNSAWRESLLPSYADHATRRGRAMEYSKKALDLHTRISWKRMSATSNEAKKAVEATVPAVRYAKFMLCSNVCKRE